MQPIGFVTVTFLNVTQFSTPDRKMVPSRVIVVVLTASAAAFVLAAPVVTAFSPAPSLVSPRAGGHHRFVTAVRGNTKAPPTLPPILDISYGEESRKYRRTVYSHDDWRKHRSPDRFLYYISTLFSSGIYKNLGREVSLTTAIATVVVLFNAFTGGFTDFAGVKHAALISSQWLPLIGLPLAPFTLSSPALGLLLGTLHNDEASYVLLFQSPFCSLT